MSISAVRKSNVEIVNEVLRKLQTTEVTNLGDTKFSTTLVDFLNDVIDECSDYGDWQEMYREVDVTASSSVGTYEMSVSAQVKNIYEVVWGDDVAPLEVRDITDLRRLQRLASFGTPRQFAVVGVSGVNPLFRVYPIPTQATINAETSSGGVFNIAYYKKPGLITAVTADTSSVPAFPSRMLVQGVYAKALLEENGGEPTREYQVALLDYQRMRKEAQNRFTADTGIDIQFVPTGSRGG